jgi:Flp pilus assembly protein TadG
VNRLARRFASERLLREETGAIAIIVAIFMVALLVIAALVLDLGTGYEHDSGLQAAADAAALAGAQELINPSGNATAFAQQYLASNVSPGALHSSVNGGNVTAQITPAARSVTVDLREAHVPFNFAQIIGNTEGAVSAHAKAELMYLTATPLISPVAIPYLHPANFTISYGYDTNSWSGGNSFGVNLTDPGSGGSSDTGQYTGSGGSSLNSGRIYAGLLTAKDANGNELMAPINVGSLYVPSSSTSPIQSVNLARGNMGGASETVTITVGTYQVTDPNVYVDIMLRSGRYDTVTLNPAGNGVYSGTKTITPSFQNGMAVVSFQTAQPPTGPVPGSTWPTSATTLASYTMFEPGQSIVYVDQNRYSGSGSTVVSAVVQTKAYSFGTPVIVSSNDVAFKGSYGDAGFADMLTGATFDQELKVALGMIPMDPSWKLRPDTEGGNNNGQADIGEQVPIDPGIRNTWGASLMQAQGKPMLVALVASSYPTDTRPAWLTWVGSWPIIGPIIMHFLDRWFLTHTAPSKLPIVNLGAIQVNSVSVNGTAFTLGGTWTRYLGTGTWTSVKPGGLYVETAVLTE